MGDIDTLHSYSYTPDVAAALVTLGTRPDACGSVWHLPVAETRTTRAIIDHVYRLAGHRPRSLAAGRTTLRLLGLVKPAMREYLHTLYQFTDRWVVDDTKFRDTFGDHATPLDEALAATLQWYRDAAAPDPRPEALAALPAATADPPPVDLPLTEHTTTKGRTMNTRTTRRLAAAGMASAAGLAIAGFTALGSIFDYPKILDEPTADILTPLPREPGRHLRLVPGARHQRRAARPGRPPARSPRRRDTGPGGSPSSAWPRPPSRSSGCRAGCSSSRASATTPWCRRARPTPTAPSSSSTPGSARPSARRSATR